jgi:hypothetical protein
MQEKSLFEPKFARFFLFTKIVRSPLAYNRQVCFLTSMQNSMTHYTAGCDAPGGAEQSGKAHTVQRRRVMPMASFTPIISN